MSTLNGIGPGGWNSKALANAQLDKVANPSERALQDRALAESIRLFKPSAPSSTVAGIVYRLYTEDSDSTRESLIRLVSRYFEGATITYGIGLWQGATERNATIEIIASADDLQSVTHLAGDIRFVHGQTAVLVTWTPVSQLLVTAR